MISLDSGAIPDVINRLKPIPLDSIAAYTLFPAGGIFLGEGSGLAMWSYLITRCIDKDPEGRDRIVKVYKSIRVDMLRKDADVLDGGRDELNEGRGWTARGCSDDLIS